MKRFIIFIIISIFAILALNFYSNTNDSLNKIGEVISDTNY
ncbi:MAG: hypothetical protein ACP5QK_08725 [Myxococcota bacterium]